MTSDHQTDGVAPIRVAEMCTDVGVGGIARHTLALGSWLRANGHLVFIAATRGDWLQEDTIDGFLDIPTVAVGAQGGSLLRRLGNLGRAAWLMRKWLKANRIDVIHAHESAPALVALIARVGLRIPLVITYHGSDPDRVKGFGAIARHADQVVTPSFRAADDLSKIGGVPKERLQVIGLGIDPAPEDTQEDVDALRADLIEDGERLVVTVARLAYQKGIDILIDCVMALKEIHPGYRFVVIGDGPLEREMRDLAISKGVETHLTFAGRNDTPFRVLRASDLMLLTSRWEALPISIVEAFQTGTPVVATDCSGVRQLVDEKVGACVPIGDIDAISKAVTRVLEDEALRNEMGQNALARSTEDRFDPDHVNRQFEALYTKLCGTG